MGSIVLSGATSGATTITPSATGTYTITIPNATGTMMVSGNMPAFIAYASAGQTISSANTKIQIDTVVYDTASCFNTSTYRFTPNVAGYYQVNAWANAGATTFTTGQVAIFKNGSITNGAQGFQLVSATAYVLSASGLIYCNGSTDYLEFYVYTSNTSNTSGGIGNTVFQGCLIRTA